MNKRRAKKKRKKEEQQHLLDFYAAIAELPTTARRIGEAISEVLDGISEALSKINIEEVCKQIQEQREQGEQDGAQKDKEEI